MSNISITDKELTSILNKLNIKNIDELFEIVPKKFLSQLEDYNLFDVLSEQEIDILLTELSDKNSHSKNSLCFLGGGSYDHYIPKVVDTLSSRSEFYTAYTPYQPEVSQGTLQYLYEFQTMICNLSGMEISNASLYDCASSIAEACSMALNITRKNKILYVVITFIAMFVIFSITKTRGAFIYILFIFTILSLYKLDQKNF